MNVMAEETWQIHAHRGGRVEFNQGSCDKGLRGFETDVLRCRDGALVITHDDSIERTTRGTGTIEDLTEAELRLVRTRKGNPISTRASVRVGHQAGLVRAGRPGVTGEDYCWALP